MQATYGVDTTAGLSLRKLDVFVQRLPPGSWPDERDAMSWSVESHLTATLIDAVSMQTFELLRVFGGKPKQPKPFYRPKSMPPPKSRNTSQPPGSSKTETGQKLGGWAEFARTLIGMQGNGVTVIEGS